jgi:hypothetical protein
LSTLKIPTAKAFEPLLKPARYKGVYGGRGSGKSHFFGELLVETCQAERGTLAVCIREAQRTLAQSSKRLIEGKIAALGLDQGFRIFTDKIETPGDGVIIFRGMQDHTAESIKSLEGFRIAWVDEAQSLSARSLALLRPTIRTKNSELWASWKPHGLLDPATLEWLDATLTSASERPALLFLHHPPFKAGIWHMDRQDLFNADALAEVVRRHPRIRLIATGHIHRATFTMFAGVPTTICPAPNHAVDLDLAQLREPSFKVEPPAFHLHVWFPGEGFGDIVTHNVPIGQFDGPHPFFGPDGKLL